MTLNREGTMIVVKAFRRAYARAAANNMSMTRSLRHCLSLPRTRHVEPLRSTSGSTPRNVIGRAEWMEREAMDWKEFIRSDPEVHDGQASIAETRIPASVVLDRLAAGMSKGEILKEYPTVTIEGIRAALSYGAALAREERFPLETLSE